MCKTWLWGLYKAKWYNLYLKSTLVNLWEMNGEVERMEAGRWLGGKGGIPGRRCVGLGLWMERSRSGDLCKKSWPHLLISWMWGMKDREVTGMTCGLNYYMASGVTYWHGENWGEKIERLTKKKEFSFGSVRLKVLLRHLNGDFNHAFGYMIGFRVEG